jgi:SAM-dependent methyltransferase
LTIKSLLKLDLGSGSRPYKDYLGVDIGADNKSVIKRDVLEYLRSLPKNSVSHIYSRHYLEHANSDQLAEILSEINRVLVRNGEMLFILPHYSNPFFYSDPTHKTFFGVHTFSYFCETSCLNRHVPSYASIKGWHLVDLKVNFVPMLKIKIFGFRLPFMSDILNLSINSHFKLIELYERYLASIFSIYQVKYFVIKR